VFIFTLLIAYVDSVSTTSLPVAETTVCDRYYKTITAVLETNMLQRNFVVTLRI